MSLPKHCPAIVARHTDGAITDKEAATLNCAATNFLKLSVYHKSFSDRDLANVIVLELRRPVGERRHEQIWRVLAWLEMREHQANLLAMEKCANDPAITRAKRKLRHG